MKISEIQEFVKSHGLNENMNIETLFSTLITYGKIENFTSILIAYAYKMEKERDYTKCELIETATLLHNRRAGFNASLNDRELHMINKYSSLSCEEELAKENYDERKQEEIFREIYNLK